MYRDYKLVSLNVNGLNHPIKRSKVMAKMKKEKNEIIFFQETHLSQVEHEKLKKFGYMNAYFSSFTGSSKRGVSILIHNSLNFESLKVIKDGEGRFVLVRCKIDNSLVTLFNVYFPPGENKNLLRKVFELIDTEAQGIIIFGGDVNMALNSQRDTTSRKRTQTSQVKMFKGLLEEAGLMDIWRDLHPLERSYSHYSASHGVYARLDYIFIYNNDRHRIQECNIGAMDVSDHSPIYLKLHLDSRPRKTIWRLNTGLLNNIMVAEEIKTEIKSYIENNDNGEVDPNILWDALKAVIRGKIIAISSVIKKTKEQKLKSLEEELRNLEKKHMENNLPQTLERIKAVRKEIDIIYKQEIEKKHKFLRQNYYEAGPKATRLLARRLRKERTLNTIVKIKDPITGKVSSDLEEIERSFESYYKTLYTQPPQENIQDMQTFLNALDLPSIGTQQNKIMTKRITEEELDDAIGRLKNNKTPGSDGLPAEWYKTFTQEIKPLLLASFNWTLKKATIPPSWDQALISVILKEGKNKELCGSYRPISILNQDYKIYASIIAGRLNSFLPDLIDEDQTGFVRGRQTQDNIRRTLHVLQHVKKKQTSLLLTSLDAEKAFDCVSWKFLFQVLKRLGFSEGAINSISALYSKPIARIRVNGRLTDGIKLARGTRQGCPLSATLFAIFVEPLAQAIRENENIKGIDIKGTEHKIALYADDVILYLNNPDQCLPHLFDLLKSYGTFSGYKLNINKTQVLPFHFTPKTNIVQEFPFNWNLKAIKYLGVWITKEFDKMYDKNYLPINTKIKNDLDRWSHLPLTLCSRIETIKMNILPRLLYLFMCLPVNVSAKQFNEWDKQISRFIWNGRKPRIKYLTLQLNKEKGGMALPNLKDYYNAAQLRFVVSWCDETITAKWKAMETNSQDIPVQAMLGDKQLAKSNMDKLDPITSFTLQTWFNVVKRLKLEKESKKLRWVAYDTAFEPGRLDQRFRSWSSKGITSYSKITEANKIQSFQFLKDAYDLEKTDFFRYLQLRHYFIQEISTCDSQTTPNNPIQLIAQTYIKGTKKIVSKLYQGMLNCRKHSTEYIKEKWEKELNTQITAEQWINICETQYTTTSSNTWREFCWKNITRYFITPKIKSKQLGIPQTCWRGCVDEEANHYHVFWGCSRIQGYWNDVLEKIQEILDIQISKSCLLLYLGDLPDEITGSDRYLMKIFLAAGKKAITRKWLQNEPPNIDDWLQVISEILDMERMTAYLRMKGELFENRWRKWLEYERQGTEGMG